MDGGPWNPWIPSKVNSHCPARDKEDDSGIVAIPHLSRDLMACFDGNGSNFGTHPQNVLRGMIYYRDAEEFEYPYLYNLIDQYRHLAKYNDGTVRIRAVKLLPTWVMIRGSGEGRDFYILPLDQNTVDEWGTKYDISNATVNAANNSYARTMGIVGEGLTEVQEYLAQQKDNREQYYYDLVFNPDKLAVEETVPATEETIPATEEAA
jgi:hypothetical protein